MATKRYTAQNMVPAYDETGALTGLSLELVGERGRVRQVFIDFRRTNAWKLNITEDVFTAIGRLTRAQRP